MFFNPPPVSNRTGSWNKVTSCARFEIFPSLGEVMRVDRETFDPGPGTSRHRPSGERPMEQRHQRLRQAVGQRAQAVTETGTEDEGVFHAACLAGGAEEFKPQP